MATAAQIEANRRNAQRSTGPKTDGGKARVRHNAFKHGMTARAIVPTLPQENPKELENRTQQAITAMKPRNPLELDLVCRTVQLQGRTMGQSGSGRPTWPTGSEWPRGWARTRSARKSSRRFTTSAASCFFRPGSGRVRRKPTADDYQGGDGSTAQGEHEGCRWLLARWAELRNVLDRKAAWRGSGNHPLRRAAGQARGIKAHFDPELNSLFHAFDALGHRVGHKFWKERRDGLPLGYNGGFQFVPYREIAPPPSDETAALILIGSVIERHVGRLEELLAEHEANRGRRGRRAVRPRGTGLQPGIRAAPPLPVRPAPRAAANAGNPSENAECGIRNGEWGRRKGGWQMSGGG